MPYQQPTLSDLFNQGLNDVVASNVTAGRSLLPRSILRVLTWMFANLVWGNYDYLSYCYRQAVPWTAEDEALDAWGAMRKVVRKDAETATLTLVSSGGSPLIPLPAGTAINRADGLGYTVVSGVETDATGSVVCQVQCSDAGADGNCDPGTGFTLATAIAGINASFTSTGTVALGADQESDDELRTRIMEAYASRDGGGRAVDYVEWALSATGVTRAWCNPNGFGAGTVVVYPMLDDVRAAENGFPQGTDGSASDETRYPVAIGDQLFVADTVRPEQPVTALVIVCSPAAYPIDVALSDLSTGVTAAAITAALADLFLRKGTPLGMTLSPAAIEAAILSTGASTFTLKNPISPVVVPVGSLPTVGKLDIQ
ncbi:baseplate J/gp47 family protein [Kozakia baliensis]|uniref:Uncharacterized protein n=1 Tax=Kozakia baliensis TaxID=153496 RepID=A0A1D8UTD6_9PROT|nr:baseplate J/gp47 family protein [Kozakia baliensis]AOX16914.1 hypothetical protein A0U89_06945 [Kozakia baliensis]GBR25614.1 bacteriophage protein [Kozakia baliensis NRIC 0488]GEL64039.1 hypothetical protein KBA01_13250 [Kozakia baliensis]